MKFRKTTAATLAEDIRRFAKFIDDPEFTDVHEEIAHWLTLTSQVVSNRDTVVDDLKYLATCYAIGSSKERTTDFNRKMDELCRDDFFGTEGQCDPRGDHRD